MELVRQPRGARRVGAERMHGLGGLSGFFHQLAPAGLDGFFALVYQAGRQFPGEALQRRPVLPQDRIFSVRRASHNGELFWLPAGVIKLGRATGREFDLALDDLHPRRHLAGAPGFDLGPVAHPVSFQRNRGTGSGVISFPRKPLALSLSASSSAMCQEKITAQSGWSTNSLASSTTGICVPGIYLPIFSEPGISHT